MASYFFNPNKADIGRYVVVTKAEQAYRRYGSYSSPWVNGDYGRIVGTNCYSNIAVSAGDTLESLLALRPGTVHVGVDLDRPVAGIEEYRIAVYNSALGEGIACMEVSACTLIHADTMGYPKAHGDRVAFVPTRSGRRSYDADQQSAFGQVGTVVSRDDLAIAGHSWVVLDATGGGLWVAWDDLALLD